MIPAEGFVTWATKHYSNGWHPIPIGRVDPARPDVPPGKVPWFKGQTGYQGEDADPSEFDLWPGWVEDRIAKGSNGMLNLGVRCPAGVVGIDVDAYAGKRGLDTLAEHESRLGSLPPTFVTTARPGGSGIRWFRVPPDWIGTSELKAANGAPGHVELIQRHHRLAAVPPSIHHTGAAYRLYGPDGDEIAPGVLPPVAELAELPECWSAALDAAKAGGRTAKSVTDEQVTAFGVRYTDNRAPRKLDAVVRRVRSSANAATADSTRNATRDALCWAAREARTGDYPWSTAVERIEVAARDAYTKRAKPFDPIDFQGLCRYAVREALAENCDELTARTVREYGTDSRDGIDLRPALRLITGSDLLSETDTGSPRVDFDGGEVSAPVRARFGGVSAAELAAPVEPMRWLVRGVWPQRSAGVLAGEKKTFKTWNLQALALAVASGVPFLGQFEVPIPGPVLYLCGEGGRDAFANRHQVIAKRYGIGTDDLAGLQYVAEFDTDELTSADLKDGIAAHLDRLQPVLVILDPLYAYHPTSVEAANLYARGPMLAALRELIEPGAALIIGDHFKKGAGDGLDLDHISMAGVGQWADTWALQRHRLQPDLATNDYRIEVEFSTRRGGGQRWNIDWHLDRDPNPDLVAWTDAQWAVSTPQNGSKGSRSDIEIAILTEIERRPWTLTRSTLHTAVGGRRQTVLDIVKGLLTRCEVAERAPAKGGGKATVLGPGKVVAVLPAGTP